MATKEQEDMNLARSIHILKSNFDSLCGIISVRWHRGYLRDERVMCKKCLKCERGVHHGDQG